MKKGRIKRVVNKKKDKSINKLESLTIFLFVLLFSFIIIFIVYQKSLYEEKELTGGLGTIGVFSSGDGSIGNPYIINNCLELQNVSNYLNAYYILGKNIDCSDWCNGADINLDGKVGDIDAVLLATNFGRTNCGVSNNWCTRTDVNKDGVVNEIDSSIIAMNGGRTDCFSDFSPIGGYSNHFTGSFNGNGYVISNLNINKSGENYIGLFGYNSGNLEKIKLENVNISGYNYVGGVTGANNGDIIKSSVVGNINGGYDVGGLVGFDDGGLISECYSNSFIHGEGDSIGGLVGLGYGTIKNSYSNCEIIGDRHYSAGIVGNIGYNLGKIINSYSVSKISGGVPLGGLIAVGYLPSITESYYDNEICDLGTCSEFTEYGRTGADLKNPSWSGYSNWDFNNIWSHNGIDYPILKWRIIPREIMVYGCKNLTEKNIIYTLQNNIITTGTCFNITANNVTLDMRGFSIMGDGETGDYGIYVSGYNQTTIKNGSIYNFERGVYLKKVDRASILNIISNFNKYGIFFSSSNNSLLRYSIANNNSNSGMFFTLSNNNTLTDNTADNNSQFGIPFYDSHYNNITRCKANFNEWYGIMFSGSSRNYIADSILYKNNMIGAYLVSHGDKNILINNNISSNGYNGIKHFSANDNIINNNHIYSNGWEEIDNDFTWDNVEIYESHNNTYFNNTFLDCASNYSCIQISSSSNNTFDLNIINNSKGYGIHIYSYGIYSGGILHRSNNNRFINMNLTNIAGISVYIEDGSSSINLNNTFINVNYFNESVSANSELIRKWYYQAYVKDIDGTLVSNADLRAYNVLGQLIESLNTDSSGYTLIGELIDYVNSHGIRTYYSNYSINVGSDRSESFQVNVSLNKNFLPHFISLSYDINPPVSSSSSSGSSSGGSSGGGAPSEWTKTYSVIKSELIEGYSQDLLVKERLSFKIEDNTHYLGINKLNAGNVYIKTSVGKEFYLYLGSEMEIDFNKDDKNDIIVKLITYDGKISKIFIKKIIEDTTSETNISVSPKNKTSPIEISTPEKTSDWIINFLIIIIVIIILGIIIVFYFIYKKQIMLKKSMYYKR